MSENLRCIENDRKSKIEGHRRVSDGQTHHRYHVRDLSYDLWTTSLHFPFLAFSPYPTQSFAVRPIADCRTVRSGPYHTLRCTRTLCSFYLSFVFKTFVSTLKKKEVFPPELRLKFVLSHCFAPLHLRTFALSHTSNTLRLITPSRTFISHHFALLDTTSGDHFTAPESHPSEPHRIYT